MRVAKHQGYSHLLTSALEILKLAVAACEDIGVRAEAEPGLLSVAAPSNDITDGRITERNKPVTLSRNRLDAETAGARSVRAACIGPGSG